MTPAPRRPEQLSGTASIILAAGVGSTAAWKDWDGFYHRSESGGGKWEFKRPLPDSWKIAYEPLGLTFRIHPTSFKHTGLFPEQAVNWEWFSSKIRAARQAGREVSVLNLFGYTGAATCAAAKAGAAVCHVDAAEGMVKWCRENAALSGLAEAPVRYLTDDCLKFVRRELKRGRRYDAVIMDPPTYGRGGGGDRLAFNVLNGRMTIADSSCDVTDEAKIRGLGDSGVLAMIGDSTNALHEGESGSEARARKALIELAVAEVGLAGKVEVAYWPEVYNSKGFQGVIAEVRRRHPGVRLHGLHGTDFGGMTVRGIYDECGWIYPWRILRRDKVSATAIRAKCAIRRTVGASTDI